MKLEALSILLAAISVFILNATAQTETKPNIILIIADDLNDYVPVFGGHPQTSTIILASFYFCSSFNGQLQK